MRQILFWVNLLSVLLALGQAAVAVCLEVPAAVATTPPCVPPFDILEPGTPKKALNDLMAGNARVASGKALLPNRARGVLRRPHLRRFCLVRMRESRLKSYSIRETTSSSWYEWPATPQAIPILIRQSFLRWTSRIHSCSRAWNMLPITLRR